MRTRVATVLLTCACAIVGSATARADLFYPGAQNGAIDAAAVFAPSLGFVNPVATDGSLLWLTDGVKNDLSRVATNGSVLGVSAGVDSGLAVGVGDNGELSGNGGMIVGTILGTPTSQILPPSHTPRVVPEPSTVTLLGLGAAGLFASRKRRRLRRSFAARDC